MSTKHQPQVIHRDGLRSAKVEADFFEAMRTMSPKRAAQRLGLTDELADAIYARFVEVRASDRLIEPRQSRARRCEKHRKAIMTASGGAGFASIVGRELHDLHGRRGI